MLLYISAGQGTTGESSHQSSQRGTANKGNKVRVLPGASQSEMSKPNIHPPAVDARANLPLSSLSSCLLVLSTLTVSSKAAKDKVVVISEQSSSLGT